MGNTGTNTIQPKLLLRIEEKRELSFSMPPLPADESQKLHEEQKLLHTYYSNAIAGNTLTLAETRAVVTEGETIEEKSLQEHRDAMNTATAFERMETLANEGAAIDHATVQAIHAVVTGAEPDDAGKYRRTNIRAASAAKAHPNWTEVMKLMNQLLVTVRNSRLHPIETAAYFYHGFGDIHPFTEGNGRVGRLCTCLYLMERTYPPVVLKKESRKRYTQLIKAADAGDIGPFSDYLAKAVDESLTLSLAAYGGEDELMPVEDIAENLGEDSPYSAYSPEYLRHRAEQGVLDAVQMEHTWYTSRRALDRYLAGYENDER
ncbi:Fic family protein [Methanogenium organophilum]|uniref:Fic family protein n=1 Tax=Methanogenium organophilum TaxID=2199 RepID=A0A9X9S4W9_METOG|nr:Fic family protein [Methanogenium organophilum]WAI01787.1 Fic family protein [Methanogenium organophilum]